MADQSICPKPVSSRSPQLQVVFLHNTATQPEVSSISLPEAHPKNIAAVWKPLLPNCPLQGQEQPRPLPWPPPGGVPAKVDPNGVYQVEQMYVQYFIPQNQRGTLPLLMWHGGGLTGVTYETTPDGRITLKEGECMGACGEAPVLLRNNKHMLCGMSNDKLDKLLEELK